MKKYLMTLIVMLAMTTFAGSAFAAAVAITPDSTTTIAGAIFTPSTGVTVNLLSTSTAYSANSKHLSGNKCYATLSVGSDIETDDCAIGSTIAAPTDVAATVLTVVAGG